MTTKNKVIDGKVWCYTCHDGQGAWLEPDAFYLMNKENPDEFQPMCKECAKLYKRKYRKRKRAKSKATEERALMRQVESEQELMRCIDGAIELAIESGATGTETDAICAKLKRAKGTYWSMV